MKALFLLFIAIVPLSAIGVDKGVKRQEPVRVRIAVGAVMVETTAIATTDGRPGEVIRVRNKQTQKTYAARVVGPGLVDAIGR